MLRRGTLVGVLAILVALLLELHPNAASGFRPYQICLILIGIGTIIVTVCPVDTLGFRSGMALLSIMFSIIFLEIVTANIDKLIPAPEPIEIFAPDDLLGKRVKASAPGHDERGWRNVTALDIASIVTLGDSQTWGNNASVTETWPARLEPLIGQTVYNMSLGGYGPTHYEQLAHEAIALQPNLLIVAFYFGNDVADAYNIVYENAAYTERRLLAEDAAIPSDNLSTTAVNWYEDYRRIEQRYVYKFVPVGLGYQLRHGTNLGRFLNGRGAVPDWFLPQATLNNFAADLQSHLRASDEFVPVFANNIHATVLTPNYRWVLLRQDDPRIVEGLRLTTVALANIQTLVDEQNIQMLVVLIPTKETVYVEAMRDLYGTLSDDYLRLIAAETDVREQLTDFMNANQIAWFDTLPALQASFDNNIIAYPPSIDGHPTAAGYQVIANAVAQYLLAQE
jgi:lysophospholipase L1-like esterase